MMRTVLAATRRRIAAKTSGAGLAVVAAVALAAGLSTPAQAATPGQTLWVSSYDGPGTGFDAATALAVGPDGSTLYAAGGSQGASSKDYATVAYNAATGSQRWASRYDGPAHGEDFATAVAVSPDASTVFVTGVSLGKGSKQDYATVAYNAATGAQMWVSRYNGRANGNDAAFAIGVSRDGQKVFVTGLSQGRTSGDDYATVAYATSDGRQLWVSRYNGRANGRDAASALAVNPGGNLLDVTGSSQGRRSAADYATVAYSTATGQQRWVSRYNGPGNGSDAASALAVAPNGGTVVVTGSSRGRASGADYATVAYRASTGKPLWARRYAGRAGGADFATAIAIVGVTTVYVTGTSQGKGSGNDWATVAYDGTGKQLWVSRYDGLLAGGDSFARAIAASPAGSKVYVTGASTDPADRHQDEFVTIAYTGATGAQAWLASLQSASGLGAYAVATAPDGSAVYVTGVANQNFLTVGYGG